MHVWVVYAHILGALLFMLAHGASAAVVFRLRSERDPLAIRTSHPGPDGRRHR